jgi:hypothetical protein
MIVGGSGIYVPYTLGGETIEVAAVPGHHPDRRRLIKIEAASVERITPILPHFPSAAAAQSSTGTPNPIAPGSASSW